MKNKVLKVLFIIDTLSLGGKERRLLELLKGLEKEKAINSQLVILSERIFYSHANSLNITMHKIRRKTRNDPLIFWHLFKICRKFRPDIIHSWESMCSIYSAPIAKIMGIVFINGMITNAPEKLKPYSKGWIRKKLTFPFSDYIIANSYAGLKGYNAPKDRSLCIHNGFDFSRIQNMQDAEKVKNRFDIKASKVVGMVAAFTPKKDYRTYINAAEVISKKVDDVSFLAVGDGSTLREIKNNISNSCRGKIKFLGKQRDVESIINIFDIGVLLTNMNIQGEGISNAILEYMALGKPVIAYKGGGSGEIVVHNQTGFLIEPFNINQLIKKIEYLFKNENQAKVMGIAGKNRIMREFCSKEMIRKYIDLYINSK